MKKIILIFIFLLSLTGCGPANNTIIDNNPDQEYFSMAQNYTKGISGFYVISNNDFRLDTDRVELGIMKITSKKYSINNTYYQPGQYLKKSNLKRIVDDFNAVKLKNQSIKTINYIYESNYINKDGKLKAISLAINISNLLKLTNAELIKHFEENIEIILKNVRKEKKLNQVDIIIGIYQSSITSSTVPGGFIGWGSTKINQISLKPINQQTFDLNNPKLKQFDENTYQSFYTLSSNLRRQHNNIILSGSVDYDDKSLQQIIINCNVGAIAVSNLMAVGEDIINEVNSLFSGNKQIKIIINNNNKNQAFIVFNDKNRKGSIYLLQ